MITDPNYEDVQPDDVDIGDTQPLPASTHVGGFADDEDDGTLNTSGGKGG